MNGYSNYASRHRAQKEEDERKAAKVAGRNPIPLAVNDIGPARTYFAKQQGRKRISGYSAVRQGGRDEARARAEERKQGAFAQLNEARSRSFTGLNEPNRPDFARAKTPALDAAFGEKDPEPLKSSDPRGAHPDMGPKGKMGAYKDVGPRGTMGAYQVGPRIKPASTPVFKPLEVRSSFPTQEVQNQWKAQMQKKDQEFRDKIRKQDEVYQIQKMVVNKTQNLPNAGNDVAEMADEAVENTGMKVSTRPEKPWFKQYPKYK